MSVASQGEDKPGLTRIHFFGPGVPCDAPPKLEVLGGKGINLCELTRAGFPVPPGFVVTTAAYKQFVDANDLGGRIHSLAWEITAADPARLESVSAEIRSLFAKHGMPEEVGREIRSAYERLKRTAGERVAVRSSATAEDLPDASFAGQQDTYLNVRGDEALLDSVKSCWGSLWTARAMGYRAQQGIPIEGLALAVVVQKMVMADAAGIMFTANPVSGARNEIVINAAWGLGEAIVGGHVTPDTLVVDKATGKVKEATISEKTVMTAAMAEGTAENEVSADRRHARVLDDEQAGRLAAIGLKVEQHYRSPQDIEWCIIKGEFFLVQARPITALPESPEEIEKARQAEIQNVRKLAEGRGKVEWAIYNLAETLKCPTPLTWDVMRRFMGGSGGFVQMYRDLGYFPSRRVDREGILDLIGGRIYADLVKHAELFYDQWPHEYDVANATDATTMLEAPPGKFNFQRAGGKFLLRLPVYMFKMARQSRRLKKTAGTYLEKFENEVKPCFLEYVRTARAKKLSEMTDEQVLAELEAREQAFNAVARESEKTSFIAGFYHGSLSTVLEEILGQKEGQSLATRLMMGLEGDKTVEQNCDLYRVAEGQMTLEQFMSEYGHRAAGEFELAEPRWYEDSSYLKQQIESYRKPRDAKAVSPMETHRRQKEDRAATERELSRILDEHGAASLEEDIRSDLASAQRYMPYRETSKHYYMMAYALIRDATQELARRWQLGPDFYFLYRDEIKRLAENPSLRQQMADELTARKARWRALQQLDMPEFVSSDDPDSVGRRMEIGAARDGVLTGKGVASGVASGVARIVHSPKTAGDLGRNYVLVCTSTDPGWTPLFVQARGVIVERGGMLSHGAIVARDFGIPCVVLPNATKLIPDKTEIKVDGNRGNVELLRTLPATET